MRQVIKTSLLLLPQETPSLRLPIMEHLLHHTTQPMVGYCIQMEHQGQSNKQQLGRLDRSSPSMGVVSQPGPALVEPSTTGSYPMEPSPLQTVPMIFCLGVPLPPLPSLPLPMLQAVLR